MIAILIPVFNRNVVSLVTLLQAQAAIIQEEVEIIVMDDGSADESLKQANRQVISRLSRVQYIELPYNTGRNIIRHTLAAAANYNTLIFLDADSSLPDELWLQRYLQAFAKDAVVMGGRAYRSGSTGQSLLHFHYGQRREQRNALRRNSHPYRSFLACNFMISRQHLSKLIIDKHLHGYCHEDTFMGLQFEKLNLPIRHIDNPVYHEGIDEDLVFMEKQEEALDNLKYLCSTYYNEYNFKTSIKLVRTYKKISDTVAGKYLLGKIAGMEDYFRKNALRSHRLYWLDLWKLAVFHRLSAQQAVR